MKKVFYVLTIALLIACGGNEDNPTEGGTDKKDGFNRKEMLTFWADDIIIPGYTDLATKTKAMNTAIEEFVKSPSETALVKARNTWKDAYISWQKVSMFQIGQAQDVNLVASMNTYPTNVTELLRYAREVKNPNFASTNLKNVQGFPALDYLLNGVNGKTSDADIVVFYKSDAKVKEYLQKVSTYLNSLATGVHDNWKGNYKTTFINNDGSSITSSVDKMVNFYVVPFYEKQLRENKIVTPAGIRKNDNTPEPMKVEAYYYGKISKTLYTTALTSTVHFFQGKSYDGTKTGNSLQQYLEFLNRKDLANKINADFKKVADLSSGLEENFVAQVEDANKRKVMLAIFDALQVVLKDFKPDMMSAMSITNTSTDTDND